MKKLTLLIFCVVLGIGSGWAAITGTTNPNSFTQDYVDWCQYGCTGASLATPQAWLSNGGLTGTVGLNGGFQNFYNLQQGNGWNGNFPAGMGLIYNGAVFGNVPTGIVSTFDTGVVGVGAFIQANFYGPFSATISLFDQNSNFLGAFTANGVSNGNVGTALFIGAYGVGDIFAAQFDVVDLNGNEDFSIGQMNMNTTPEPGTLVLFGSSALGLAGYLRRRFL
jgi:hypothetical protein